MRLDLHRSGQGLAEYALILTLVSMAVIGILTVLGPTIGNTYSTIMSNINLVVR